MILIELRKLLTNWGGLLTKEDEKYLKTTTVG